MTSLIGQEATWNKLLMLLDTPCHIFLTGNSGNGRTTIVKEFLHHYSAFKKRSSPVKNYLNVGTDQDRGIQTIRGQISLFIRQIPDDIDIYKWVIIDDADTFPRISQQALRRPMELYSKNTRFIFIGSSYDDLIPAIRSRCIHIKMSTLILTDCRNDILNWVDNTIDPTMVTETMWMWIINISGNNIGAIIRILKMICNILKTNSRYHLSIELVKLVCSVPIYLDFMPLITAFHSLDNIGGISAIILLWKKGYTYEDILDSFETIYKLFGNDINTVSHIFLVNAWISYCKGNTSILALQHAYFKTIQYASNQEISVP